jgi:hypothetical protein
VQMFTDTNVVSPCLLCILILPKKGKPSMEAYIVATQVQVTKQILLSTHPHLLLPENVPVS